jgi:hypothetical protein
MPLAGEGRVRGNISIFSQLPFFKGGKGLMIHRFPSIISSPFGKGRAGGDFWESRVKPLNCYKKTKLPMKTEGNEFKGGYCFRFFGGYFLSFLGVLCGVCG